MTTRILALEKDLFFSVKMRDTLRHHDMEVTTVRALPAFEQLLAAPEGEGPELVIVNTATTGVDWESAIRHARTGYQGRCPARRCQFQICDRYAWPGPAYAQRAGCGFTRRSRHRTARDLTSHLMRFHNIMQHTDGRCRSPIMKFNKQDRE